MSKILVPVDFSPNALNALHYSIQLVGSQASEVTVLHTYGTSSPAFHMKSMASILAEDAQREMERFLKQLASLKSTVSITPMLIHDQAIAAITALGNRGAFDYIVMGTKGATGLKKVFAGSVASGVMANTTAPVIVVPEDYSFQPLRKVVLAVGDTPFSNPAMMQALRTIVEHHQTSIEILHITEGEKPQMQASLRTIQDLNPIITYKTGVADINDNINHHLEQENVDLLCLIRSSKGFFQRIFTESVTLKQTFDSPVPLLVLHDQ